MIFQGPFNALSSPMGGVAILLRWKIPNPPTNSANTHVRRQQQGSKDIAPCWAVMQRQTTASLPP